ncbi:phytoene dehydrogenase [Saccharothrix sp. NRRL B-16348]|uniref:phytoene desaturase family protein n=1 Tax=Saccharothrix sp. NRRL B-16348 TaxID=1415542 RepID=UPI0006AE88D5|nr:phytoene desaturase family protein [Saccharothrix sp. NRRL B-16348]KOX22339.1 phytoene dehydrogenase [Saccharothrix sp. NRRL B-16348]
MRAVTGRTDHVVVVGAGLAGLSAALHLLGAGRRVTVVERDAVPGGRAGRLDLGGYRFDTGPTVLTMPELVDEALNAVGDSLADRLDLRPVHPAYRARFADGSTLDVHSDGEAMEAEVRRFAGPREAAGYRALRRWLTELYRVEREQFIGSNFDSPLSLVTPALAKLAALRGFSRLGPSVARFVRDERLQRVFSFQSLYAGVPPRKALAAYAVIAYMDTIAGVHHPEGGMRALPDALAAAARDAGADLRFQTPVAWLERIGGRVTAVRTTHGERIPCDAVVLTPDLPMSYRLLGHRPRRPLPITWSPSAVVLHAGVDRTWPELAHHTLFFGREWDRTFDELTRRGTLMSDPSLLVTAPPGQGMFVLAPAPNLRAGPIDWERVGPAYRDELVGVLEARGLTGFGDAIEVERLVTPADWAAMGLAAGTPFSAAHTFAQTGPFRPRNLVLDNAVLAGCGTTPGVGVPPVLISGRLAAQRITGSAGARSRRPAQARRAHTRR